MTTRDFMKRKLFPTLKSTEVFFGCEDQLGGYVTPAVAGLEQTLLTEAPPNKIPPGDESGKNKCLF
jgi:hypothetical protein